MIKRGAERRENFKGQIHVTDRHKNLKGGALRRRILPNDAKGKRFQMIRHRYKMLNAARGARRRKILNQSLRQKPHIHPMIDSDKAGT